MHTVPPHRATSRDGWMFGEWGLGLLIYALEFHQRAESAGGGDTVCLINNSSLSLHLHPISTQRSEEEPFSGLCPLCGDCVIICLLRIFPSELGTTWQLLLQVYWSFQLSWKCWDITHAHTQTHIMYTTKLGLSYTSCLGNKQKHLPWNPSEVTWKTNNAVLLSLTYCFQKVLRKSLLGLLFGN